jgi:hypothetical protein
LCFRRTPEIHKRLMLLGTTGGLLPTAIKRLPYVLGSDRRAMLLIALFLAAAPLYDRISQRKVSAISFWGGVFVVLSFQMRFAIGLTDVWHRFGMWLIR